MSLYHLVYISTAYLPEMPQEELSAILAEALKRNAVENITGMLLYSRGMFMQVLEGYEEAVLRVYDLIKKDRRHISPRVLLSEPMEKRSFSDWHMGFHWVRQEDTDLHTELMPYLQDGFDAKRIPPKRDMAMKLLQDFSTINRGRRLDNISPPLQ